MAVLHINRATIVVPIWQVVVQKYNESLLWQYKFYLELANDLHIEWSFSYPHNLHFKC